MYLLGYSHVQKGYRCYYPTLRRFFVSTDVVFFETTSFSLSFTVTSPGEDDDLLVYYVSLPHVKPHTTQVYSRRQNLSVSIPTPVASTLYPISNDDLPITLHKGKRQYVHLISSFFSYNRLSSHSCSFISSLDSISLPKTICEALSHPSWRSSMVEEMKSLNDNGTWNLVQLPAEKKAIGCRWVFAIKVNPGGSVT